MKTQTPSKKNTAVEANIRVWRVSLICIICLVSCTSAWSQCGSWKQRANFGGTATNEAIGFSIGTKGYIANGSDGVSLRELWEYDQATDTWSQKANYGGTPRWGCVAFTIDSFAYVGTGNDGGLTSDFWQYDPAVNSWQQIAPFPGGARSAAVGMTINGKGYVGAGFAGTKVKDFWEYDPVGDQWTQKADYGGGNTTNATGFGINGKGYFGTGENNGGVTSQFWEYDPLTNSWTIIAAFGGAVRLDASSFVIGSKGYVGTGDVGGLSDDFWEYDPVSDTWTEKELFGGGPRKGGIAFAIDSLGYFGLGSDGAGFVDFWEYNPNSNAPNAGVITGQTNVNEFEQSAYAVSFEAGVAYTWSITGGAQVSGGLSNAIEVLWNTIGTGIISVVKSDSANGCSSDSSVLSINIGTTSIFQSGFGYSQLQVSPNPSTGMFAIKYTNLTGDALEVTVHNVVGQLVTRMDEQSVAAASIGSHNQRNFMVNLSAYPSGVYYVRLKEKNTIQIAKLIKY
ncbi:MAG: T9SS type A sorting domain-containing protein [Flavobacteriales bacterium]|nr:T9SS type A sorting domain-containing protein [Flavobacteriales bacterium]